MNKKSNKTKRKKVVNKNNQIITTGIIILGIIVGIMFLLKPIKIFVHSDSSFEKIGVIDKDRSVYTYCVKKVLVFPSMNEKMSTKEFLKGTIQTNFIWDGGTSINQGIGFIVIDCQDNLKKHRSSPVIITTKNCQNSAINFCHS